MKKIIFVVAIIATFLLSMYVYNVPMQQKAAEAKFEKYLSRQGASIDEIETIQYKFDNVQGGYYIEVTFKTDPGLIYEYHYFRKSKSKGNDVMHCDIYNSERCMLFDYNEAKYPPVGGRYTYS